MASPYASGRHAIAECDRCGFRYKLRELRNAVVKQKNVNLLVCPTCWEKDHPQLMLGTFLVHDPQALQNPRPDNSYPYSRPYQWGWNPVGGGDGVLTPNDLIGRGSVGQVTVVVVEDGIDLTTTP